MVWSYSCNSRSEEHGDRRSIGVGKNNGNPTNTEGTPRRIPISKVLHETRSPPIRRCKMGNPGRGHNRPQRTGHFRTKERRSSLVLVPDRNKYRLLEIFPRQTRYPWK